MGKFFSILIGLVLLALGIWGIIAWSAQVLVFLQAAIVLMAVIIGLGIFVFGLSELRAGPEEPPMVESPPAPMAGSESPSRTSQ
jgi:ABC-type transport system involved in multi-copper enzyme maturation permease subunit